MKIKFEIIFNCLVIGLFLTMCIYHYNKAKKINIIYKNIDVVIVSKGANSEEVKNGKFIAVEYVKTMLVRMIKDTTLYAELSSRSSYIPITNSLWYSSKEGDTLHYDKIRKDRFFKLLK